MESGSGFGSKGMGQISKRKMGRRRKESEKRLYLRAKKKWELDCNLSSL
jgi:hypothetical protein